MKKERGREREREGERDEREGRLGERRKGQERRRKGAKEERSQPVRNCKVSETGMELTGEFNRIDRNGEGKYGWRK